MNEYNKTENRLTDTDKTLVVTSRERKWGWGGGEGLYELQAIRYKISSKNIFCNMGEYCL